MAEIRVHNMLNISNMRLKNIENIKTIYMLKVYRKYTPVFALKKLIKVSLFV